MSDELTMEPTEEEMSEWEALNERQKELAESYAEVALEFGMFKQDAGPDGAHYAPANQNPFKANGINIIANQYDSYFIEKGTQIVYSTDDTNEISMFIATNN